MITNPKRLIHTQFAALAADATKTGTTFTSLGGITFTTTGGNLNIYFTATSSNSSQTVQNRFQIVLDSTVLEAGSTNQGDAATLGSTAGGSVAIRLQAQATGVSAASHTVSVFWAVSGGTGRIRPVGNPIDEFATLYVEEFSN